MVGMAVAAVAAVLVWLLLSSAAPVLCGGVFGLPGTLLAAVAGTGAGSVWQAVVTRRHRGAIRRAAERVANCGRVRFGDWPTDLADVGEAVDRLLAERDQAIQQLRLEQTRTLSVILGMSEGVVAVDRGLGVLTANGAASRLLELPETALQPGCVLRETVSRHPVTAFLGRMLMDGSDRSAELEGPNVGGRTLQLLGAVLRDEAGNITGAVAVIHDITRLRRLEQVRRDFVANVSHELRTPITSIKGFVETLLDGGLEDREQAERFLRIVARQANRLDAILGDLLTLSRLEEGDARQVIEMAPVALRQPVEQALQLLESRAAARGVNLSVEGNPDLMVRGSAALIEQAVVNLVDNAIKYSDPGGTVRVEVTGEEDGQVALRVYDEGCGIPEEHLPRLFERFYRVDKARSRSEGGTGLGLAIVKHVALVHGGKVGVNSRPGTGSVFSVLLPGYVAGSVGTEGLPGSRAGESSRVVG